MRYNLAALLLTRHSPTPSYRTMKRTTFILLICVCGLLIPSAALAAPVAPDLQVSLTPPDGVVKPGQLVLVFVGGGYPLEVQGTLDAQLLPFFWNGDGYVGLAAFDLETPPGTHPLTVTASDPGGGRMLDFQTTLTVEEDPYPKQTVSVPRNLMNLLDPDLNQAELDRLAETVAPTTYRPEWEWPFAFPAVSRITSLYGADRTYNGNMLRSRHTGIDFRMPEGVEIYAAAPGRVVAAEPFDIRGNVVVLDHGWGIYTLYAHMSAIQVAVGDEVSQGQLLGKAGRTGRSTGTHLHWEVIVNGVTIDPLAWMALSPTYIQPAVDERNEQPTS
jgi:hypothetical protein